MISLTRFYVELAQYKKKGVFKFYFEDPDKNINLNIQFVMNYLVLTTFAKRCIWYKC